MKSCELNVDVQLEQFLAAGQCDLSDPVKVFNTFQATVLKRRIDMKSFVHCIGQIREFSDFRLLSKKEEP